MEQRTYHPKGYQVRPRTIQSIRSQAMQARHTLGLGPDRFQVAPLLDLLTVNFGIDVDIVEDHEMSAHIEAECFPSQLIMRIPERTWELIEQGDSRARFTFMHELGHLILQHDLSLHRESGRYEHKCYEDSEWQADQFAAEILMPVSVINNRKLFDAYDLAEFFDVSLQAASIRLQQLTKRNELQGEK
ncbi:hypothetical protein BI343_02645 [Chromobacterium amazonense]|nr:hypothetical protein BI343_02645 [Chromobacterium amazonense]